jgi:hypothetical protein
MLVRLKARHAALESALGALERLTHAKTPDRAQVASARLALSQASARRTRVLSDEVFPKLLAKDDPTASEAVDALRREGAQIRASSAEHVAAWNIDRAIRHWPEYCEASAKVRARMRERLRRERTLLYPLLD